ncbi:short chain dehydrogenase [Algimonas porphyrae]|uniref:Short chain dehydrogenase n=2 Tax=Algimonas porphyrae TaxID=1128113 RepID=A0ABQ5UZT8_9PROT|nr:SDR family oxidoreductase [Algimonas porphyrae]GLQ20439.1 short chain dehydrogenase [Algimonas porphyrae]
MHTALDGKTVLITGGANNLGGLLARDFAAHGAKAVAIHYNSDKSAEAAKETATAVEAAGAKAAIFQGDLRPADAMTKLFDDVEAQFGKIDIGINTVGMVLRKPIVEISEDDYDHMFDVNSKAAFFFLKECGQRMNDKGRIVTIVTSLLGAFAPGYSSYGGAKAPVEHFTRAASKEFAERGISVNAIGPGPMDTSFFYGQETEETTQYHKNNTALSAYSTTGLTDIEDIVPYIRMMVTEGWWMTGQTILVNGGYTTK